VPRLPKQSLEFTGRSFGNGRDGGDGASLSWIHYDRRTFGEILSDWQQAVAPDAVQAFIRDHLHLDGAISNEDFINLVAGAAQPSAELANYISACIPEHVATGLVTRRRGSVPSRHDQQLIAPSRDAMLKARSAMLREILNAAPATTETSFATWQRDLVDRIAELAPDSPLNMQATLNNLAAYINVDPGVLLGQKQLSTGRAVAISEELCQLLGFEGETFDNFASRTAEVLSASLQDVNPEYAANANMARAFRFLRQVNGMTQKELAKRIVSRQLYVSAYEHGAPLHGMPESLLAHHLITTDECEQLHAALPAANDNDKIDAVAGHFAKDGLSRGEYLTVALSHPQLFSSKPSTVIANTEAVLDYFAKDGLIRSDYVKAAVRHPQLFYQKPTTLIANIEGVLDHFAKDGLTRAAYLKAAAKQPSLFAQRPSTLIANIEGILNHFGNDGLTRRDYLKAAAKQPQLFSLKPSTLIANIEGVLDYFAKDGLSRSDYVKAAAKQPPLFYQRPSTLIANIEGVLEYCAKDGLPRSDYLRAAVKRPSLFSQKPSTIIAHINLLHSMHDAGLLGGTTDRVAFSRYICTNPTLLSLSAEHLHLREAASQITGRKLCLSTRSAIERILTDHLLQSPTDSSSRESGSNARQLLLNSLKREGYLKGESKGIHTARVVGRRSDSDPPQLGG